MVLPIIARAIPVLAKSLAAASCHLKVQVQPLKTNYLQLLAPAYDKSMQANRFYSSRKKREGCIEKKKLTCSSDVIVDPCRDVKPKKKKKAKEPKTSMWEIPECCLTQEECVIERFDLENYQMTDNSKREFQTTWVECGDIKIEPRKKCCYEKLAWPKMKRRKRGMHPETARAPRGCPSKINPDCPCFTLPGCNVARKPPRCTRTRPVVVCEKFKVPYPSYSECKKPKLKQRRMVECNCLALPSSCEVFRKIRSMDDGKDEKKK